MGRVNGDKRTDAMRCAFHVAQWRRMVRVMQAAVDLRS